MWQKKEAYDRAASAATKAKAELLGEVLEYFSPAKISELNTILGGKNAIQLTKIIDDPVKGIFLEFNLNNQRFAHLTGLRSKSEYQGDYFGVNVLQDKFFPKLFEEFKAASIANLRTTEHYKNAGDAEKKLLEERKAGEIQKALGAQLSIA